MQYIWILTLLVTMLKEFLKFGSFMVTECHLIVHIINFAGYI